MDTPSDDALDQGRRDAGLSHGELWLRYFGLGGMSTALQLEGYLYGALLATPHDRDIVVHALNERFVERGDEQRVRYSDDLGPGW